MGPFAGFALKVSIISRLFTRLKQQMPQETKPLEAGKIKNQNQVDSSPKVIDMEEKRIEPRSCLSLYFIGCFYRREKTRRYKRMLKKARTKLE